MNYSPTVRIVLADDDTVDREIFIDALNETDVAVNVQEVKNGKELLEHLRVCREFPDVIFLDLNMPVMDGRQALAAIKKSERFQKIPVFVLSTSSAPDDVAGSYEAGANLYIVKPSMYQQLVDSVGGLLHIVQRSKSIASHV